MVKICYLGVCIGVSVGFFFGNVCEYFCLFNINILLFRDFVYVDLVCS